LDAKKQVSPKARKSTVKGLSFPTQLAAAQRKPSGTEMIKQQQNHPKATSDQVHNSEVIPSASNLFQFSQLLYKYSPANFPGTLQNRIQSCSQTAETINSQAAAQNPGSENPSGELKRPKSIRTSDFQFSSRVQTSQQGIVEPITVKSEPHMEEVEDEKEHAERLETESLESEPGRETEEDGLKSGEDEKNEQERKAGDDRDSDFDSGIEVNFNELQSDSDTDPEAEKEDEKSPESPKEEKEEEEEEEAMPFKRYQTTVRSIPRNSKKRAQEYMRNQIEEASRLEDELKRKKIKM